MPARAYVRKMESLQSFVEYLPTERLIFLAKTALDEVAKREVDLDRTSRVKARPVETTRALQPQGRTLR